MKTIMVTGGAGFIGSNFIRYYLDQSGLDGVIVNVDVLTYAGNLMSLADIAEKHEGTRYHFERVNILDREAVDGLFARYPFDAVVHFAAESHVDRSILGPGAFIQTNIVGTHVLLDAAKEAWGDRQDVRFHHVSTDEVYGSLGETGSFHETTPYDPRSPYSASKASSDHLVRAYFHTYGLPITISNCSNNYGPCQFPEKLVPLMILNMIEGKPLPVYGDGLNVRDWLYVDDHNSAVIAILERGQPGRTYNIGGENEWENIRLVNHLCEKVAEKTDTSASEYKNLLHFVKDRPGHDRRYAINCERIKSELGWSQSVVFSTGLENTIDWYLGNKPWVEAVRSGEYRRWIELHYGK